MAKKHVNGPFSFPVHDIVRLAGVMRTFQVELSAPEKWGEGLVAVEAGASIELDLRLEAVHEGILATGTAVVDYEGICGRCLTEITRPVEVEFQELFGYPGDETTDFVIVRDFVDVETLVRDAIVLSLPFQPVCQPDCPGLDPETGEKLAADADAATLDRTDPRWATLQTYTKDPDAEASRLDAEYTEES